MTTKLAEFAVIAAPLSMNRSLRRNLRTPHPTLSPLRGEGEESPFGRFMVSMRYIGFGEFSPQGEGVTTSVRRRDGYLFYRQVELGNQKIRNLAKGVALGHIKKEVKNSGIRRKQICADSSPALPRLFSALLDQPVIFPRARGGIGHGILSADNDRRRRNVAPVGGSQVRG
jgi:hypothetical protein